MTTKIHIEAGTKPNAVVERQIGRKNAGLYCEACGEFFAIGVAPKGGEHVPVEFTSDGPVAFECPYCHHFQQRPASEILFLVLTQATTRRNPPVRH